MFKIYNKNAITRKQRMQNAIVCGTLTAVLCTVVLIVVFGMIGVYVPLLYVARGFVISWAIRKFGHGVQIRFSILAVILTALVIVITDFIVFGSIQNVLTLYSGGINALWNLGYRAAALILAFQNARIF